jgi:AcrR family transcriptional regulator
MARTLDAKLHRPPGPHGNTHIPKQARALKTREKMLAAARMIFARDGFEHARIEDIAARAGKTRGAFYDHFKSKEDAFFALFEQDMIRDQERIRPMLRSLPTVKKRIAALAAYIGELGRDKQRILLHLEFKQYAIRHPRRRQRLADMHATMRLRCYLPEIDELLPQLAEQTDDERRTRSLAISAILDGYGLNRLFDMGSIDEDELTRDLERCVRETLLADFSANRNTRD